MTIAFPAAPIQPLLRPFRNEPVALLRPPKVPERVLVATIDWVNDYGASSVNQNVNVLVNVQIGQGNQQAIDTIRSVKIDNLGNNVPVYVSFLDTTDTVACPANAVVYLPVVTNSKIANVFMKNAVTGQIGVTTVYFTNVFLPPYIDVAQPSAVALYQASPALEQTSRLNNNFQAPALGDQHIQSVVNISATGSQQLILGGDGSDTSVYIITGCSVFLFGASGASQGGLNVIEPVAGLVLFSWSFQPGATPVSMVIYSESGMNYVVPAKRDIFFHVQGGVTTGGAQLQMTFTYKPNA